MQIFISLFFLFLFCWVGVVSFQFGRRWFRRFSSISVRDDYEVLNEKEN